MKVIGIVCHKCGDFVFSRTRHDMRWCSCKSLAIDGGFDYTKVSYLGEPPKTEEREIEQTKKELYDDWNTRVDKYGRISPSKEPA